MTKTKLLRLTKATAGVSLIGAIFLSGCSQPQMSIADPPVSVSAVQSAPLLVCVLQDKSLSMATARSTPVQESDLLVLIDALRLRGGALAFGLVGESSDLPLVRLKVSAPPQKPVKPSDKNPFIRAETGTAYSKAMKLYEADYHRWNEEVNRRVENFLVIARPRLRSSPKDRTSPVFEALSRAQLFLGEPGDWPENKRRMIILQSDAKDSTRRKSVHLKPDTTVVIVNGSGSLGSLANMQPRPRQFEAVSAVVDFLQTEMRNQ